MSHVFYLSVPDDHVRELYYDGGWQGDDLTAATHGPQASNRTLSSFFFDERPRTRLPHNRIKVRVLPSSPAL